MTISRKIVTVEEYLAGAQSVLENVPIREDEKELIAHGNAEKRFRLK